MATAEPTAEEWQKLEDVLQIAFKLFHNMRNLLADIKCGYLTNLLGGNNSNPIIQGDDDILDVVESAALRIHSQGTKISVLLAHKPFSPKAVASEVAQISCTDLGFAVQACLPDLFSLAFYQEMGFRAWTVVNNIEHLLQLIPRNANSLDIAGGAPWAGNASRTGMLWDACDRLRALARSRVSEFYIEKVKLYRTTLEDILRELKTYAEPAGDDDGDDPSDNSNNQHSVQAEVDAIGNDQRARQDFIDEIFRVEHLPSDDPHRLRPLLERTIRRVQLVIHFYSGLIKRRFAKLPQLPNFDDICSYSDSGSGTDSHCSESDCGSGTDSHCSKSDSGSGTDSHCSNSDNTETELNVVNRLDDLQPQLSAVTASFNHLVEAFYMTPEKVYPSLDHCISISCNLGELFVKDWQGQRDQFSDWIDRYRLEMNRD
ncbi:hypothetical protein AAL_04705 [Moelleriella libera RCEF 2490]|uniref:Cyclin-D1-binding protein 1-like N-terminal domain-containing protein n=1 Tax=Moelleriella libera RCEF 2490 TaxID=1081109 RepID=A0A168BLW9_9HYPO|nr:hypothetical protein AAL_04705 [Moelleriella libera RCEF 2490]